MKTSLDLMMEFFEKHQPHGQKAMAEFLGVNQSHIATWKMRGGLTPANTVKIGMALGYSELECYRIAAREAERTEKGKSFLERIANSGFLNTYSV